MANTIIGLDFGTHSIKLVRLAMGREPRVIGYDIEPLPRVGAPRPDAAAQEDAPQNEQAADPNAPDTAGFDDAPTQVRHRDDIEGAPTDDAPSPAQAPADADADAPAEAGDAAPDTPADHDPQADAGPEPSPPWQIALDRLIERGAFDDEALIVTFLPDNQAMSIRQDLPFFERAKVETILPHMLNDRLPVDASKVIYDFQLMKKHAPPAGADAEAEQPGAEAIIGFARREEVGHFLGELKGFHIDPALLGIPELLLTYALERCAPQADGTYAVVDIGHRHTRVLVLEGRDPVVARSVQFGGEQLTQAIAARFESTPEQAEHLKETRGQILGADDASSDQRTAAHLALNECLTEAMRPFVRDLRRTFQSIYAQKKVRIDEIFICGGTSLLGGLPDYLSREFGVPVSHLDAAKLPGLQQAVDNPPARLKLALAASAALQPVDGRDEERVINLRRQEFSYRGKSSYLRARLRGIAAAVAVLFLLLMGMLWAEKVQLEAQRDAMRAAVAEQTTELFGEPVYAQASIQARLSGEETSGNSFIPRMSAYELYYQLASHIPSDAKVRLDRFEIDVERNIAQIYGETTSPQAVEQLIDDLKNIDCLQDVRQEGELKIKSDSAVDFHLHVSSECA